MQSFAKSELVHGSVGLPSTRRGLATRPCMAPARRRVPSCKRRAAGGRAAAEGAGESAPDNADDIVPEIGDWRAFKSRLLASSAGQATDTSRETPENMAVLREHNQYLADEGIWASPTEGLEPGTLLLATPEAPIVSGDGRVTQLVVLVLRHDPLGGTVGLMLNRPCFASVGDLLGWGWNTGAASEPVFQAFSDQHVYLGGMFAPNKVARQKALMIHGQADLPGCQEVAPGIYAGGEQAAALRILQGSVTSAEYRFFSGSLSWQPGQLEREIEASIWTKAACSRSVVLKQCWQLPVPLWREVNKLMGVVLDEG